MDAIQKDKRYTYADYVTWDCEERYELIDGVPYMMSAPLISHQAIVGELFLQIGNFLKGKKCKPFVAPVDVRLNFDKSDDTVVQPDIIVVCDPKKYEDGKSVKGAPDLVIEILSPSTSGRDLYVKFNRYLWAGVREYWVVNPEDKGVSAHILTDGKYVTEVYEGDNEAVPVSVLDGCTINLQDVFAE